ncbi:MAG: Asp23/Gls24 family envelope stress response protein [Thermotogaceae bacterium]|nr:Asp23/Gls24 family envelope stress response protein [Thermotogaceae bacterium]
MILRLEHGELEITLHTLKRLAYAAILESYGPVNIATENIFTRWFGGKEEEKIKIEEDESGKITVDLYLELEYGVKISEVAKNIIGNVTHKLKNLGGCEDVEVNVHVTDIH